VVEQPQEEWFGAALFDQFAAHTLRENLVLLKETQGRQGLDTSVEAYSSSKIARFLLEASYS